MKRIEVVPLGIPAEFRDLLDELPFAQARTTLQQLFERHPFLASVPLDESLMTTDIADLDIRVVTHDGGMKLYAPADGFPLRLRRADGNGGPAVAAAAVPTRLSREPAPAPSEKNDHPLAISEADAALLAYGLEVERVASFLRSKLSVLVVCEKLVVEYLWKRMVLEAKKRPMLLDVPDEDGSEMARSLRQRELARLKTLIKDLKDGDVLVVRHLDLLAGGSETNLSTESRELIGLLYQTHGESAAAGSDGPVLLAFADRSLDIPEVLAARFAVRIQLLGLPKEVVFPDGGTQAVGQALVTKDEACRFSNFTPEGLYKNVAGMNPVRFRHAVKYAVDEYASDPDKQASVQQLYEAIRAFKAQTSAKFEVPNVRFKDIGGYQPVKDTLLQALAIMAGSGNLRHEELRRELIPRGFLFYGPPGTGKTLFAKAVANEMNATIQIVSGPEVTDMYVGESERKVRELFAEARRNAPAVLVFDEFDSIGAKRSGRDDGGSRAGNALVAQILTEMDGFRPDVPMLVIGTTNRLDIIDEALLRPSRFRAVSIGLPDPTARRAIARVHAKHFDIEVADEVVELIAEYTEDLNGDDIRSIFRDACVGLYCENPPIPADARRLGYLVGKIRQSAQQRRAESNAQRAAPPRRAEQPTAGGGGTMRPLVASPASVTATREVETQI